MTRRTTIGISAPLNLINTNDSNNAEGDPLPMEKINSMQGAASSMSNAVQRIRKMKSYNHLFETYISDENIRLAIKNLGKHKRKDQIYKLHTTGELVYLFEVVYDPDRFIPQIREYAEHFYNMPHTPKVINDGSSKKRRTIIVPTLEEQIVHHMIVNVLKPIFMPQFYEHSYGSIPGKGQLKGKQTIEKWIHKGGKSIKYCLKMDIRHYYQSIDHDVLKGMLAKKIHDLRFLEVMYTLIDATDAGLPLGFYTSQWLANWYLTPLDHYIKEQLHAEHYIRYIDDMVIFGSNKKALHRICESIAEYLNLQLNVAMKEDWQVFRFHAVKKGKDQYRFLDFLGYRFYRNRTTLRKRLMLKMVRTAARIGKKDRATIHDCRQMMSYLGWLKHSNVYAMYLKWIKPFVSIQKLKRQIAQYDRKEHKNELETVRIFNPAFAC